MAPFMLAIDLWAGWSWHMGIVNVDVQRHVQLHQRFVNWFIGVQGQSYCVASGRCEKPQILNSGGSGRIRALGATSRLRLEACTT